MARAAISSARPRGRVVIVDDVISDGAAKREAIELIRAAGATPAADTAGARPPGARPAARSAVQEIEAEHGIRV